MVETKVSRVVALMGSYRREGKVACLVKEAMRGARDAGAHTQTIVLRDRHIEFCRNCRGCTLVPGEQRGRCLLDDDVAQILDAVDAADALVLAAPVNFDDVNALTRQLLERMICYGYWPFHKHAPRLRKRLSRRQRKPALLISSSAAPGIATRLFARPLKTLKRMTALAGARPVGSYVLGLADCPSERPGAKALIDSRRLGLKLVECVS